MADWALKANYNNPLFTVYHTLQFARKKRYVLGEKSLPITTATNARTLSICLSCTTEPNWRQEFRCFVTLCHIAKFCLHVLSHRHVLSKNSFRARFVTLFQQHCNTSFPFPRCVYRRAWMHSRAVLRCVLLSPLQILIKMNLFCILGRLQGHRCQLCQI